MLNQTDLIKALDDGHIKAAALDVFSAEPLPEESDLWQHPGIHISPHMSGATCAKSAIKIIIQNIQRLENNEKLTQLFDREKGH